MTGLAPLETLYEAGTDEGIDIPLPPDIRTLYGRLHLPLPSKRPYVIGNFVTTLDGVASLNAPGQAGGGEISGFNQHDQMVMGLLRAVADAVIVGAGTLRAVPRHLWTAEYIYPALAEAYEALRASLSRPGPPLNVIVTAQGEIDLTLRVFQSEEAPALIVTTEQGARRLRERGVAPSVKIASVTSRGPLSARAILEAVRSGHRSDVVLVEGGPQLIGDFFAEQCLDELFLTLSPQIAGRAASSERPGLVAGKLFAPERPLWGNLVGVKRGGSHLFLRYAFRSALD
ncbi:MAG: dihydrofolate reductase family protein [Chloroflexi bacterium]|nr:dihydrofolate reductase family protein [Chloroflexota bacterium]